MSDKIAISSCIRDASNSGGGIASAVLPLHKRLCDVFPLSRLNYGVKPRRLDKSCRGVSVSGKGLCTLDKIDGGREIVHIHGLWTPFEYYAYQYAMKNRLPFVFSPHGMLELWAMRHKAWKKYPAWWIYQKRILNKSDLVIVNSNREKDGVRRMGVTSPVAVIANGIDAPDDVLNPSEVDSENIVLFISRLSPVKGLPDLLAAWKMLPDTHGYKLHIYGYSESGYEQYLQGLVEKLDIKHSVSILGPVYGVDKWNVYKNAKLFILPSYSENFGIAIAEAMYSGLPVITSYKTPWQVLRDNNFGWLTNNDPSEIAEILEKVLRLDDMERKKIGENAATYARKNFQWETILKKYKDTYKWLLHPESSSLSHVEYK